MTRRTFITRRRLSHAVVAGATLIGAPLPLRHGFAQTQPALKVALLLPTSGIQAPNGEACRRGADVANDGFGDMKMAVRVEVTTYDTESKSDVARIQARLEQLNKDHGTRILVSQSTRDACGGEFTFRSLGAVPVRGRMESAVVYAVDLNEQEQKE